MTLRLASVRSSTSLAFGLKIGQTLAFSLMYAAIKWAGPVPATEALFFRCVFALLPLALWASCTVGPAAMIATRRPWLHLSRSTIGVAAILLYLLALKLLPLATVIAFSFTQPLFAVLLSALLLREQVDRLRWTAVAIGFGGVLVMLAPRGFTFEPSAGLLIVLAGSVMSALIVVLIKRMTATERSEAIVFYFMAAGAVFGGASMLINGVSVDLRAAAWLVIAGVLGGVGQICMTYSYQHAEASVLAPLDCLSLVWAVLIGYYFFAETPESAVLIGAAIVCAAGLFMYLYRRAWAASAADAGPAPP